VKTFPPTVIVAFLVPLAEFADTVYFTVPLPGPLPEVTVIQDALGTGVQLQPAQVDTLKVPDPPAAGNDLLVGEIE